MKKQNIYMIYLSSFCLFLIKVYRVFFSIHFGGACRFYPSCSCYAERVFSTHPPVRAIYLVLKRLSKCQFFGPFGIMDPELFPGSESLVGLVEKNKVISRKRDDEGSLKGLKKER